MPFPLSICQRHPRYVVLLAVLVFGTFVFISPNDTFSSHLGSYQINRLVDLDLPDRVAHAETMYERTLDRRQDMIKKFGPNPSQVVMFPPDREPWPAYTVWDFFPPAFNCPHEVERIGALGDGGKWVCGLSRLVDKPDCVVYSFGLDWESSFEAELLERTRHCEVWGYDYTARGFGRAVRSGLRPRTHFARLGMGASDSHGPSDEPKMWTLQSLMRENGHTHVDLLHIDIEGWEFEALRAMVRDVTVHAAVEGTERAVLPFGQLLIEMHIWHQRFDDFLAFWELLEGVGLRPFRSEVNLVYANYNRQSGVELADYSFINIRGDNTFVSDGPAKGLPAAGDAVVDSERDGQADEPDVRMIRHAAAAVDP
ncbi:uncharacterized protein FIBRA_06317 [Fibroporia radiculosa]|uniref:Methyltransferase domain-containing protein n=1 Tax=Fibroporia radiculosa TaxID=599839 RepID=J4GSI9_9APHY|nr:uncharacterized protein FIBRA_06317 [Fibroporia radiculosa]CCM04155.1 predicted protein [Fibroporia radiculosa]